MPDPQEYNAVQDQRRRAMQEAMAALIARQGGGAAGPEAPAGPTVSPEMMRAMLAKIQATPSGSGMRPTPAGPAGPPQPGLGGQQAGQGMPPELLAKYMELLKSVKQGSQSGI